MPWAADPNFGKILIDAMTSIFIPIGLFLLGCAGIRDAIVAYRERRPYSGLLIFSLCCWLALLVIILNNLMS